MNFDFLDEITATPDEDQMLAQVAVSLRNYLYEYKDNPGEFHMGIIAQDLLKVPGLESLVIQDAPDGILRVDTSMAALACLGLIATLAKKVVKDELISPEV